MILSKNILMRSFLDSDSFGRSIFFSLFLLSILCWIAIAYKIWLFYQIKKLKSESFLSIENGQNSILTLKLHPASFHAFHPFNSILIRLKEKTVRILEKNRYFITDPNESVFLSKDDLETLAADLDAAIAKEVKKIENGLFILNGSVSLAPFLGILGTVWGILISLFEMQKGSSAFSNTVIIQGLSTALATTVLGLLIAIPALIGSIYLKSIAKSIAIDLALFSQELLSQLGLQYKKVT